MHRLLRPSLLSLLAATAACAGNTSSSGAAPGTTGTTETTETTETTSGNTLRIENRTNYDMDIFVRGQSRGSVRVGFVPGGETATFKLSPAMVSGVSSFRVEARPISGGGNATVSEPYPVRKGEETFWSIPP